MSKVTERARELADGLQVLNAPGDPHTYIGELRRTLRAALDLIDAQDFLLHLQPITGEERDAWEKAERKFKEATK